MPNGAEHATICAFQVTDTTVTFPSTIVTDVLPATPHSVYSAAWHLVSTTCGATPGATIQIDWFYHDSAMNPQATSATLVESTSIPGATTACCCGFQCTWNVPVAPIALPAGSYGFTGTTLQATVQPEVAVTYCTCVTLDVDLYTPGTPPH